MNIYKEKQPKNIPEDVKPQSSYLYSDEPQLESYLHLKQMMLLITCLEWFWKDRTDFFAAGNLTIYYRQNEKKPDFRGPDFFVVLDTNPDQTRKSWVVWEEQGKYPNIIVELLSSITATTDKTSKKKLYQDTFRTPEYFLFDPESLEFAGFHLVEGKYQPIKPNESGYLWSEELGLYLGVYEQSLRYFTPACEIVPTVEEDALLAEQQTEVLEQQTEVIEQQTEVTKQQIEVTKQQKELAKKEKELAKRQKELAEQQKELAKRQKELAERQKELAEQKVEKLVANLRN